MTKKVARKKTSTGRPTAYRAEYDEQAHKLALLGLTNVQMAEVFGVAESTFQRWMTKNPSFSESLKKGRVVADADVAVSLRKRALGYEFEEVKVEEIVVDGSVVPGTEKRTRIKKHVAPDTAANYIWLKNRQPELWRDKREKTSGTEDLAAALREVAGVLPD